ncbi:MAG: PCMD domain-containing protein, partial [Tannerellaceae bacterium]
GKSYTIDAHLGSTAMEISTVGWGKNNWTSESSAAAEYKQAGLLYIGTFDRTSQAEVHGQPFSSRPSALEFYYKYYPLNEEQGKATIILEDESHQEIGRGELRVGDTQSFTQAVVPVAYSVNKKAAFLRVEFVSTDATAPATVAVQGSKGAWNAGYGDSRHIGSILTIDDVKLIY